MLLSYSAASFTWPFSALRDVKAPRERLPLHNSDGLSWRALDSLAVVVAVLYLFCYLSDRSDKCSSFTDGAMRFMCSFFFLI